MRINVKNKNRKGLTMAEVMITLVIFSIALEGFTLLFIKTWRSNSYTLEMGQSSMAVSQGLNKIVNYIRGARQADNGAYAIKSANDNDLVIYSDYDKDGVTERIHLYKSDKNILMGITNPTTTMPKTYPSEDQDTKIIASAIVNEASIPIFYYYNKNYPADTEHNPMSTPANVADIKLVKIYLKINIDPNRAPDNIEIQSFAEMRNLNDYDRIK